MDMGRTILTGDLILPDGHERCTIGVVDGRIEYVDIGETVRDGDGEVVRGSIYPGLFDMHAHLGDHGARGHLPPSLEDTVLPGGLKHRFLENASGASLLSSIRASIRELSTGTTRVLDFREGGIEGVKVLRAASEDTGPRIHPLGRPEKGDDPETLIDTSDGLGMPSLESCTPELRELCRNEGKVFALHASELFREDMDRLLELDPDLVVHMVSGTRDDWRALAERNIPVAVCPRANRTFSLGVPLSRMMDEGLMIGLGTDNALSVRQDMFREMEEAWMLLRTAGMEGSEAAYRVFMMAAGASLAGSSLLNKLPGGGRMWGSGWPRVGDEAHLLIIDTGVGEMTADPVSHIVRFAGSEDVLWTGPWSKTPPRRRLKSL